MKITIVQGGAFPVPPLIGGGVEKVWFGLGREFAKRGHEVTQISRQYNGLPSNEVIDGVRHVRTRGYDAPHSRLHLWLRELFYSVRATRILPPADILVTNALWLPLLVRDPRRGAIYVHVARYPKGQTRFHRRATRFQAVSRAVAEAIVRQDPKSANRVRVIPNPLPFPIEPIDVAQSWNARKQQILYVGRLHPEKGIHLLVRAFAGLAAELNGWRLIVVGPWQASQGGGGIAYYESLRHESEALRDRVDWVGPIFDPNMLANFYKRSRLFAYPSLAETGESFGLAPLEAMSFGCPALVSGLECFKEYLDEGRSGYTFNHRVADPSQALRDKLHALLADAHRLPAVGAQAARVAANYELSKVADLYLQDFEALRAERE